MSEIPNKPILKLYTDIGAAILKSWIGQVCMYAKNKTSVICICIMGVSSSNSWTIISSTFLNVTLLLTLPRNFQLLNNLVCEGNDTLFVGPCTGNHLMIIALVFPLVNNGPVRPGTERVMTSYSQIIYARARAILQSSGALENLLTIRK